FRVRYIPRFHYSCVQPFPDYPLDHSIANPLSQYLPERLVWYGIKILTDVHVNDVSTVYVHALFPYPVQALVGRFSALPAFGIYTPSELGKSPVYLYPAVPCSQ
ncbi:MAG: hypothetical protein LBU17_10155, partial [Treponema sp.]|nr:hypothetical protein [Treponema sp.]